MNMKQIILSLTFFLALAIGAQAQIIKGAGILYFDSLVNVNANTAGAELAWSIKLKKGYRWDRTLSQWIEHPTFSVIDSTLANNGLTLSGDTVQLGGTPLTKNTEVDINGKNLRFRDAAGYPDLFLDGTYGLLGSDANTYLDVGSTAGRVRIVGASDAEVSSAGDALVSATDTVLVTGQRIRLNAADTRIQQVSKSNTLNRVMMIDSTTEQIYYRDVSSIADGGGGDITGSGTTGTVPIWSGSTALGDSPITVTGDSTMFENAIKQGGWGLYTRTAVSALPVPYFRPDASLHTNENIALDLMPRGSPGDFGSEGIAWMDICDSDIEQSGDIGNYLRLGITSTTATIRAKKLSGAQKPLALGIQNTDRIYIDTTGRLTFSFYTARNDSTLLQPKYAFYSSGGGLVYQNPIGNFRVTNPTNATEESLQKTLYDIRASGTLPSGTSGATLRHNGTSFVSSTYLKNTDARVDIGTTSSQLWLGSDPTGTSTYSFILRQYQFYTDGSGTSNKLLLRNYTGTPANLLLFPSALTDSYIFFPSSATETSSAALRVSTGKTVNNNYVIETAPAINQTTPGGTVGGISWTSIITPDALNNLAAAKMIGINIAASYNGTNPTQKAEFRGISVTPTIIRSVSADSTSSGIFIDPVLTNTSQFFGIRSNISSAEGWSYYEQGTAPSAFGGSVAIGTTAAPARSLDAGEVRIRDLTTDTPTRVVGADPDGDLGAITFATLADSLENYISIPGTTNLGFTGTSSPVTLTSSTGTDVNFAASTGLALSQSGGTATYSRTYSEAWLSVSGGGTTVTAATPERLDADSGGTATSSVVGSEFSASGSTIDWTGAGGTVLKISGTVSFSVSDNTDMLVSIYKEGSEIAATEVRVTMIAGDYHTVHLPEITTTASTNDTFAVFVEPVGGTTTTTGHRCHLSLQKLY